jgi:hypothetical protein
MLQSDNVTNYFSKQTSGTAEAEQRSARENWVGLPVII